MLYKCSKCDEKPQYYVPGFNGIDRILLCVDHIQEFVQKKRESRNFLLRDKIEKGEKMAQDKTIMQLCDELAEESKQCAIEIFQKCDPDTIEWDFAMDCMKNYMVYFNSREKHKNGDS